MPASAITSASPSFWQVMPPRAERHLAPRRLDGLVRLDVRPVGEPGRVAVGLPALEVPLEPVEVDDERRRLELDHDPGCGSRATASTSTRIPPGSPACTVVRAGYGSSNAPR